MDTPTASENPTPGAPVTTVKLGRLTLTGRSAQALALVLLGLIVALLFYAKPSPRMLLSGALWVAFIVYWSFAAKNAAAPKSSESARSRALHQLLLNGSLLLLFVPAPGLTRRYLPAAAYLAPLGAVVQAGFGLLGVWARRHLGRNWSGEIRIADDHELVRSGPYRLVRHPIYTAMLGMYVGTAMVSGELHALIAVAIVAFAYARKIPLEERALQEAFGADYVDYRRHTWAIVPGLY